MYLGIDTITDEAGVYLGDSKNTFFKPIETKHASDSLIDTIDTLFNEANIDSKAMKAVFVVKGPGSFTGVRVGVSVANQFSHQLQIPIIGVTTDELFQAYSDSKDAIYLQSMNKDQVYMVGKGALKRDYPQAIISISECHSELASNQLAYFGQLSEAHLEILKDIENAGVPVDPEEGWRVLIASTEIIKKKRYELVEPFYGKAPAITKSKRKL